MRRVPATLVCATAALLAAGCGSDTTSTSTATTTTAQPAASTTTTAPADAGVGTSTPAPAPATAAPGSGTGFATTPVSIAPADDASAPALLTAVRAAAQDGFDRVTFEFANHLPGSNVGPVEVVLQDGSGEEVAVAGVEILQVRMTPASGFDLSGGGTQTYVGPQRLTPGTPLLAEVVQVGDFEAHLTWAIGLSAPASYRVSTLESPPRLVVDVAVR